MIAPEGVLDVLDRAYAIHQPLQSWLAGVTEALRPSIDQGEGILSFFIDAKSDVGPPITDPVPIGIGDFWRPWFDQMNGMPRDLLRYARAVPPLLYKSHFTIAAMANVPSFRMYIEHSFRASLLSPPRSAEEILAKDEADRLPWAECLALHAAEPTSADLFIVAPCPRRARELPSFAELDVWARMMAHLANACRLQRLVAREAQRPLDGAEAILSPAGRVEAAEGPARGTRAQEVLRDAARRVDRARSKKGRARPEEAMDLWQALVAGRWSLVDEFDTDGRRFLVARRNDPGASSAALSDREREVAAHLALGQSNKAIAYQLGISLSTVSSYAARIAHKLGAKSRVELVSGCAGYVRSWSSPPSSPPAAEPVGQGSRGARGGGAPSNGTAEPEASAASSRRPRTPSLR